MWPRAHRPLQTPWRPVRGSPHAAKTEATTDLQKRQKAQVCEVVDVLTNLTAPPSCKYIHASNHHAVHLTCQLYLDKAGGKQKGQPRDSVASDVGWSVTLARAAITVRGRTEKGGCGAGGCREGKSAEEVTTCRVTCVLGQQ